MVICLIYRLNTLEPQVLYETILEGPEEPLHPSLGLRRISMYNIYTQLFGRSLKLA